MADRWIEYVPVGSVPPDPRNPKGHSLDELLQSMGRFGFTEPIMIDERTGLLISGHGRSELLEMLEGQSDPPAQWPEGEPFPPDGIVVASKESVARLKKARVPVREGADGRWLMPLTRGWKSKDDTEAGAYLIAANQLTIKGGWLADPLASLLDEISRSGNGLEGVGFSSDELTDLLEALAPPPDLDDLARKLGGSEGSDWWPVLRFKVPPELRDRFMELVGAFPEEEQFGLLLGMAEASPKRARPKPPATAAS